VKFSSALECAKNTDGGSLTFRINIIAPSMRTFDALAAGDMVPNASVYFVSLIFTFSFVQQVTSMKKQIGVYFTYHVDGITGGRERSLPVASFRGGARGSADPPRIVKCKSFALSVSSKGSLYISHNGR